MTANKMGSFLVLLLFFLIPFQKRFSGAFDSFSRSLILPDFPLPECFSRNVHFFLSDFVIIALVLVLFFCLKISSREFFLAGPSKYLTMLFCIYLLSTATSITKNYSLQYIRLFEFSLIFLFFNSICILREKINFPKLFYRLAWILVFLALLECLISLIQYFSQDAVGLKFLGEKHPKTFSFVNTSGSLWLWGSRESSSILYRVCGTFMHPNILGGFLFCSVMASYFLCMQEIAKGKRLFLYSTLFLQFFILYLTFSRSAIFALILSTLLWCILQLKNARFTFQRVKMLAAAVLIFAFIGTVLFYPQLKARGGFLNYNSVTKRADSERVIYMKVALDILKENPLLGGGYNNFQIHASHLQSQFPGNYLYSKVHNIYLLIASEAGLLGGGIFLLFILSLLGTAYRGLQRPENFQSKAILLSIFFGFLIIGACDFYFLESPQGSLVFFGIAGLLYADNGMKHIELNKEGIATLHSCPNARF